MESRSQQQSNPPYRFIHGIGLRTLLVSRIYKCSHGHLFADHYEDVLKQLPRDLFMPFQLSHRSGYTYALQDYVFCHVEGTMSLRKIASIIFRNRFLYGFMFVYIYIYIYIYMYNHHHTVQVAKQVIICMCAH